MVLDIFLSLRVVLIVGSSNFVTGCTVWMLFSKYTISIGHELVSSVEIIKDWASCADFFHEVLFSCLAVPTSDVVN